MVDEESKVSDGDSPVAIHVTNSVGHIALATQEVIDKGSSVSNGHYTVVVSITQDVGGIGRSYPVTNGERHGIIQEPVPIVAVGEVRSPNHSVIGATLGQVVQRVITAQVEGSDTVIINLDTSCGL